MSATKKCGKSCEHHRGALEDDVEDHRGQRDERGDERPRPDGHGGQAVLHGQHAVLLPADEPVDDHEGRESAEANPRGPVIPATVKQSHTRARAATAEPADLDDRGPWHRTLAPRSVGSLTLRLGPPSSPGLSIVWVTASPRSSARRSPGHEVDDQGGHEQNQAQEDQPALRRSGSRCTKFSVICVGSTRGRPDP